MIFFIHLIYKSVYMKSIVCFFLATLCAITYSCKKNDTGIPLPGADKPRVEKASAWYDQQMKTMKPATLNDAAQLTLSQDKPAWDKASYFAAQHTLIVPLQTAGKESGNVKAAGYLVLKENAAGDMENGSFYYVLQPAGSVEVDISPALFSNKIEQAQFSGAIIRYSPGGSLSGSRHYNNGVPEAKEDRLLQRTANKGNGETQNLAPLDPGCSYLTIDWYWQTYQNGVLISEVYVFSTTEIVCEGGGGGGGGTQTQNIDELFERGVAAGQAVSEKVSEETINIDATHRVKKYDWRFYKNKGIGSLEYYSREYGYQEKQTDNRWIFTSLQHHSIWKVASTPNWDVTCNIVTATPTVFNSGMLASWAAMELEFDIHYRFEFGIYNNNVDDRKTKPCVWHVSDGIVIPFPPIED